MPELPDIPLCTLCTCKKFIKSDVPLLMTMKVTITSWTIRGQHLRLHQPFSWSSLSRSANTACTAKLPSQRWALTRVARRKSVDQEKETHTWHQALINVLAAESKLEEWHAGSWSNDLVTYADDTGLQILYTISTCSYNVSCRQLIKRSCKWSYNSSKQLHGADLQTARLSHWVRGRILHLLSIE